MRSITTLDLQYAHRFYGFKGEAQYLHGHTGVLTIEVEDTIEPGVNMVFPCNEIQKTAWSLLKNFDHALILRDDDPLLPAVLKVYEEQGIRNGAPQNQMKGPAFQTELATAYPECRLVVTKETLTVEGMIKIVYDLLKDKLNIAKITFTSGVNAASAEFETHTQIDRCPLCGIALNENGVCPKCGYRKGLTARCPGQPGNRYRPLHTPDPEFFRVRHLFPGRPEHGMLPYGPGRRSAWVQKGNEGASPPFCRGTARPARPIGSASRLCRQRCARPHGRSGCQGSTETPCRSPCPDRTPGSPPCSARHAARPGSGSCSPCPPGEVHAVGPALGLVGEEVLLHAGIPEGAGYDAHPGKPICLVDGVQGKQPGQRIPGNPRQEGAPAISFSAAGMIPLVRSRR